MSVLSLSARLLRSLVAWVPPTNSTWISGRDHRSRHTPCAAGRTRSVRSTMRLAPVESLEDRVLLSAPEQWLQRGLSGGGVLEWPSIGF